MAPQLKILTIAPQLPFPPVDGGKLAMYHPLRGLASRGHDQTLLCLTEHADPAAVKELEKLCRVFAIEHRKAPTPAGALRSLFARDPYTLSRFHDARLLARLDTLLKESWDIVNIEMLHCARYGVHVKRKRDIPVVLRLHNVESVILQRFRSKQSNPLMRAFFRLEEGKLRRYEASVPALFDCVLPISPADERVMLERDPTLKTRVVQSGVDTDRPLLEGVEEEPHAVLWLGMLSWPPNREGLWWFVEKVLPRLVSRDPQVRLYIAGSAPPPEVLQFRHPHVTVLGFVKDVREAIQRCRVCVVPLHAGSGIRLKLLELLSMRRAVVSTSIGCEGISAVPGKHLLVADTPEDFAEAVAALLEDPSRSREMGDAAFEFVCRHYSWKEIVDTLESVYRELCDLPKHTG